MPRTVSLHLPPDDEGYTEERQAHISHVRTTHSRPSHTHIVVCNSPTRSPVPLIRSHFRSSWVRPRPFWCHLPLTRRTSPFPGLLRTRMRVCAHKHTGTCAPSVRKGAPSHDGGRKDRGKRGCGGNGGTAEGRGGRAYSGIQRAAREEDGERRGVVSRNVGAGEAT